LFFFTLLFTSCQSKFVGRIFASRFDTQQTDEAVEILFESIESGDFTAFDEVFDYEMNDEEFASFTKQIEQYVEGKLEVYTKVGYHINVRTFNNSKTKQESIVYEVKTDKKIYYLSFVVISENDGPANLMNFNIANEDDTMFAPKILGVNINQIWVLIYGIVTIGIIILAIVLGIKSKIRNKILWILASVIQVGVTITKAPNLSRFNYHFITFNMSRFMMYNSQSYTLVLIFPVVAVLFLILRKTLIKNQEKRVLVIKAQEDEINRQNTELLEGSEPNTSEILSAAKSDVKSATKDE